MLGEFRTRAFAPRAKMTPHAASILQCGSELPLVANVSPADVENVDDFAPCG
jgi:hypothetical protein